MAAVALILGAGPNIGQAVARKFASQGYKVTLASRSSSESNNSDSQLNIASDFSNPESVVDAFKTTTQTFGVPSVVVYNVSSSSLSEAKDPFSLPLADFQRDTAINITSAFVAAQQATQGFAQLPAEASKTFIMTGNILNVDIIPRFISQGAGKSAGAHMMWNASNAYKDRGYKFYYADERKADGTAKYRVDGEAHADLFWTLAEAKEQGPWLQTFVKGLGFKKFELPYSSSY